MTRQFFIWTIFLGLTTSCGQQSKQEKVVEEKKDSISTVSKQDTLVAVPQTIFHFDTFLFKQSVDSLLSVIDRKHSETNLQIDTIKSLGGFKFYPFVDSAMSTIKYRFRPKPDKYLSFTVYESHFIDNSTASRLFLKTRAFGKDSLGLDGVPGLSYAFDFVIKYENKIFALNAPCTYATDNYKKLLDNFKKSFKTAIPSDTIACRCGWFCK